MNEIKIKYNQETFMRMVEWISENYNANTCSMTLTEHTDKGREGYDRFSFKNEEDAVMFKMRWG